MSERIPRVYATPREAYEWEIDIEADVFEPYLTRWDWMSVNHDRDGNVRIEHWGSWPTALLYCLLWAPNSAPDAIWRKDRPARTLLARDQRGTLGAEEVSLPAVVLQD